MTEYSSCLCLRIAFLYQRLLYRYLLQYQQHQHLCHYYSERIQRWFLTNVIMRLIPASFPTSWFPGNLWRFLLKPSKLFPPIFYNFENIATHCLTISNLYDHRKFHIRLTISDNSSEVFCCEFSADGFFLAAGCGDGAIRVFNSQVGIKVNRSRTNEWMVGWKLGLFYLAIDVFFSDRMTGK